jgi:hypothetical protein
VATVVLGGCGEPPAADRGPSEAARTLSEFVEDREGGAFVNVRCLGDFEHEYRCTGDYRDPYLNDPKIKEALIGTVMSTAKDGIPSQSRESASRELADVFEERWSYIVRFDLRDREWRYKRLCEAC